MKKNQILAISIGLIALGGYLLYKEFSQKPITAKEEKENSQADSETPKKADFDKLLKRGSKGREVEILQTALKQIDIDGDFGEKTEQRLKSVIGLTEVTLNQYNELLRTKKK